MPTQLIQWCKLSVPCHEFPEGRQGPIEGKEHKLPTTEQGSSGPRVTAEFLALQPHWTATMVFLLGFLFLCGVTDHIGSVSITTPEQTIQEVQGETVHLPCMFTFISKDQGPLNIEWLRLSGPNNEAMDHVVILYSADKIHDDVYPDLKGRVYFTSNDIKSGDASINITNVQLSDAGTYQCKVKTYPGTVNRNLQLAVTDHIGSVSITTPEQTIQKARGETVHLPCTFTLSPEDHGPLFIDWMQLTGPQNEVVNRMFIVYLADKIYDNFYQDMKGRVQFTSNDIRSGEASINITDARLSDAGTYQCGVSHAFGTAKGTIQLTVVG